MGLYQICGWALALLGAATILHALIPRRARGLPHCPHCRFNMSGINGLKCPECGKTAKNEQALFQRRGRRRRIALGLLLIPLGFAVMEVPKVLKVGLPNYTPGWALRAGMPGLYLLDYKWTNAFVKNYAEHADKKAWRRVLESCVDVVQDPSATVEQKRWAIELMVGNEGGFSGAPPTYAKVRMADLDPLRTLPAFAEGLHSPDPDIQIRALLLLQRANSDAAMRVAIPWMIAQLSNDATSRPIKGHIEAFVDSVRHREPPIPPPIDLIVDNVMDIPLPAAAAALKPLSRHVSDDERLKVATPFLVNPDPRLRVLCYWYLGYVEGAPHAQLMRDAQRDSSPHVREVAPWLGTRVNGDPDHIIAVAREMFATTDFDTRRSGAQLLEKHGTKVSAVVPFLLELIRTEGPTTTRGDVAKALSRVAEDDAPVVAAIQVLLEAPGDRLAGGMLVIRLMVERHPEVPPQLVPTVRRHLEELRGRSPGPWVFGDPAFPLMDFLARFAASDPAIREFIRTVAFETPGSAMQSAALAVFHIFHNDAAALEPQLLTLAGNPDPYIRSDALEAMRLLRLPRPPIASPSEPPSPEAFAALKITELKSHHPWTRQQALAGAKFTASTAPLIHEQAMRVLNEDPAIQVRLNMLNWLLSQPVLDAHTEQSVLTVMRDWLQSESNRRALVSYIGEKARGFPVTHMEPLRVIAMEALRSDVVEPSEKGPLLASLAEQLSQAPGFYAILHQFAFEGSDAYLRHAAIASLRKFPDRATELEPLLRAALTESDYTQRNAIRITLKHLGLPAAQTLSYNDPAPTLAPPLTDSASDPHQPAGSPR